MHRAVRDRHTSTIERSSLDDVEFIAQCDAVATPSRGTTLSKEDVLDRLLVVFRRSGYDGASLSEISRDTGLGKSSLYHYFPGGKQEMATEVLAHLESELGRRLYEPLHGDAPPAAKLETMLAALHDFYDGGRQACLLERLGASTERTRFSAPLQRSFAVWISAIEQLCLQAGLPAAIARARAEDFVVRVEGALVVAAGTDDPGAFTRTLRALGLGLLARPSPRACSEA